MKIEILSDEQRKSFRAFFVPFVKFLVRLNIHPNILTCLSLLFSIVAAVYYAGGSLAFAGFLYLVGGLFDMIDGAVARMSDKVSVFGAFFDSVLDRYTEAVVLIGIFMHFYFHDVFNPITTGIAFASILLALTGSLMVSYTRARAEALGLECKVGLLQRPERLVLIAVASFISNFFLLLAIILTAILANFTAVQRIIHIYKTAVSSKK